MVTCNFKPLGKWHNFKAVCGGIRTYVWTSARSHAHHLADHLLPEWSHGDKLDLCVFTFIVKCQGPFPWQYSLSLLTEVGKSTLISAPPL
ncbi:hypothetical protein E2C01_021667 [Portunus trituberculatus]|uniref:Uncharacterized protein n=1 Tax=Portunus trituberculatus TaxID=210409 RepID=A0A5B7E372_PORTR|nr:hypothetical protein [Portunus trituberculatus]